MAPITKRKIARQMTSINLVIQARTKVGKTWWSSVLSSNALLTKGNSTYSEIDRTKTSRFLSPRKGHATELCFSHRLMFS
jgi:hypothetical protein